jgi:hypothetical protein
MRKTLAFLIPIVFVTCMLWSTLVIVPSQAVPAGWSGDSNLEFQLKLNGTPAPDANSSYPVPVLTNLTMELTFHVVNNLTLSESRLIMQYLGITLVNVPQTFGAFLLAGYSSAPVNVSIPLGSLLTYNGIALITGTIIGSFSFIYNATAGTNKTVSQSFVLRVGPTGAAAIMSVAGLITVAFTATSVFGLLLSLDDFQRGIMAARKTHGAKRASDVGIFPSALILRRRPKKDAEKISKEELVRRVSDAAKKGWDGKRCPQCGHKWAKEASNCPKCRLDRASAVDYFSKDIAEYAPKALNVVKPKSKMPVGTFSRHLRLKRDKGGALAAALTDMGVFQTKSVKVPLIKVAMAGMTLAGTYWSWMQMIAGATPSWLDILFLTAAGLVVSVLIAYFMNWLARVPKLGYED